jgi:hypothetical protein
LILLPKIIQFDITVGDGMMEGAHCCEAAPMDMAGIHEAVEERECRYVHGGSI